MDHKNSTQSATIQFESNRLLCHGSWTREQLVTVETSLRQLQLPGLSTLIIDGRNIVALDSAGAWLILRWIERLKGKITIEYQQFSPQQQELLDLLSEQDISAYREKDTHLPLLAIIGKNTIRGMRGLTQFLTFLGETVFLFCRWIKNPQRIRWKSIAFGIQAHGYAAMPIVSLLAFLIGVVLAYQLSSKLVEYGASIYVVDLLGFATLREFAPLITAIILAGRTGSAYAAQLGTMVLTNEVDALRTFGLSPIELLVLPRISALLISLPLLTVLSSVAGILGGMYMSNTLLDISYVEFLRRFSKVISLDPLFVGMVKTPIFALLISTIGCFQGFQVKGGASSIGYRTTISVVQAIFLIIIADAVFSVLFSLLGI